ARSGNEPDFARSPAALIELAGFRGRGMMIVAPGHQKHRGRRQIADMIGGHEVRQTQSQAPFAHPNNAATESLIPIRKTILETMGKGAADIDVTAFQDKSIDALEMLGGETNRRRAHGNPQGSARLSRPAPADQVKNRHDVPAFMEAEAGALSTAFPVRAVIEGHASVSPGHQTTDPTQHRFL